MELVMPADEQDEAGSGRTLPVDAARQILRCEGEFWTVVFGGGSCRMRDSRGLHHLAYLLRHPHERIAAAALDQADSGGLGTPASAFDPAVNERARVNVTRALSTVLKRLDTHHPTLAVHLRATLRTGAFCAYTPDPRVGIAWEAEGE